MRIQSFQHPRKSLISVALVLTLNQVSGERDDRNLKTFTETPKNCYEISNLHINLFDICMRRRHHLNIAILQVACIAI